MEPCPARAGESATRSGGVDVHPSEAAASSAAKLGTSTSPKTAAVVRFRGSDWLADVTGFFCAWGGREMVLPSYRLAPVMGLIASGGEDAAPAAASAVDVRSSGNDAGRHIAPSRGFNVSSSLSSLNLTLGYAYVSRSPLILTMLFHRVYRDLVACIPLLVSLSSQRRDRHTRKSSLQSLHTPTIRYASSATRPIRPLRKTAATPCRLRAHFPSDIRSLNTAASSRVVSCLDV